MQVQQKVYDLFEEQLTNWEMARKNFAALDSVLLKTFDFDDFKVCVQFNPVVWLHQVQKLMPKR